MELRENLEPSAVNLFYSFLRLGLTAFGGPAMVAYIKEMAVTRHKWLDEEKFKDGVALCKTMPGATAMQTAAYVGLRARGIVGALASFAGFGLPAFIMMLLLFHRSMPNITKFPGLSHCLTVCKSRWLLSWQTRLTPSAKVRLRISETSFLPFQPLFSYGSG